MAEFINTLLFGIYPYVALVVLAVGTVIRYDREPYSWRTGSSQLLRRKQLMWGSLLFHVGVLLIFAGHLVGLRIRWPRQRLRSRCGRGWIGRCRRGGLLRCCGT